MKNYKNIFSTIILTTTMALQCLRGEGQIDLRPGVFKKIIILNITLAHVLTALVIKCSH